MRIRRKHWLRHPQGISENKNPFEVDALCGARKALGWNATNFAEFAVVNTPNFCKNCRRITIEIGMMGVRRWARYLPVGMP